MLHQIARFLGPTSIPGVGTPEKKRLLTHGVMTPVALSACIQKTPSLKSEHLSRYLEVCEQLDDEQTQKKLEPTAVSCILNTAACKLKLQLWQAAVDSCDEVK